MQHLYMKMGSRYGVTHYKHLKPGSKGIFSSEVTSLIALISDFETWEEKNNRAGQGPECFGYKFYHMKDYSGYPYVLVDLKANSVGYGENEFGPEVP